MLDSIVCREAPHQVFYLYYLILKLSFIHTVKTINRDNFKLNRVHTASLATKNHHQVTPSTGFN